MSISPRVGIIAAFTALAIASAVAVFNLKFTFYLEQFFPEGDPDLEFYKEFIDEFETDVNFLMVAIEEEEGVFDSTFLNQFHDFTLATRDLPYVEQAQSLTKISYPLKTPFGVSAIPAINRNKPERYEKDKARLLKDPRFVNTLIADDAKSLVVAIKTAERVQLEESEELIVAMEELIANYSFDDYHILGPAYFQKEMVDMQKREVLVSAFVSIILVTLVMWWLFRRPWGIFIALLSIGLGMLLFMGLLGAVGRPLNAMSALYPVLMIIVGTSDVIHIMSKYIDELRKGFTKKEAITTTIKEIGLATLLTSLTTAIGFATLMTSRIAPIRDFGLNAAVGVIVAYITVIFFTTALLSYFEVDKLIKLGRGQAFWEKTMRGAYNLTVSRPKAIWAGSILVLLISFLGISQITTNYRIENNLPRGAKISEDFRFFEEQYAGFRPLEFAIFIQEGYDIKDFAVIQEMGKVEDYLATIPEVQSVNSITAVYKSINQMYASNKSEAYQLPDQEKTFKKYQKLASKVPDQATAVLVSRDETKARITSRALDIGADSLKAVSTKIDDWIASNINAEIIEVRQTGTGVIIDKNAEYVRSSLLTGLGMAIVIISVLMALLFQNWRLVIISLVPNTFPLLMAGALLGFMGIELEAGISIVFAVVFGIAVDDTIHFLSKYKLARNKGLSIEESIEITFMETGKAICLTSVILFFGFLVMLFSIHPPSVTIGLLISLTLVSALISDIFTIPLLIRWLMPKDQAPEVNPQPVEESVF